MNNRFSNLPWIYLDSSLDACDLDSSDQLELDSEHYNHIVKVLRSRPGQKLVAVSTESRRGYLAEIKEIDKSSKSLVISPIGDTGLASPFHPVQCLILALLKGKRTDYAIEKATELGVRRILLFEAERSVVKVSGLEGGKDKLARFRSIVESAAAQSRKLFLPEVELITSTSELFKRLDILSINSSSRLICSLNELAVPLRECFETTNAPLAMAIGPEGDFTPHEEQEFE